MPKKYCGQAIDNFDFFLNQDFLMPYYVQFEKKMIWLIAPEN